MNNKIISAEKLTVGQFVTVLNWTINYTENSFKGEVLKIMAIDLPFIAVKNICFELKGTSKIDTRQVDLMELSEAYVQALTAK